MTLGLGAFLALLLAASVTGTVFAADAPPTPASARPPAANAPVTRSKEPPSAAAFTAPRETWQRLSAAIARGDRDAALAELTPAARQRYASELDQMLAARRLDARFGRIRSVTLSGSDFATLSLVQSKDGGTYGSQVMLVRGADGRWRVSEM